jgi:hypothetical protein
VGNSSKSKAAEDYEKGVKGARTNETGDRIVPALKFKNPNPKGRTFIRFDGIVDKVFIDRNLNVTTKSKQVLDIRRWIEALNQNPAHSIRIEVPNTSVEKAVGRLLDKAEVAAGSHISVKVVPN